MRFLLISQHAGFRGGIELFQYRVSQLLREHGHEVDLAWVVRGQSSEEYLKAFSRTFTVEEVLSAADTYQLTIINNITNISLLERIMSHFRRLAVFQHGHLMHCPKAYGFPMFKKECCARQYKRFYCALCACKSPAMRGESDYRGAFRELVCDFPKRMKLYQQIPLVFVFSQYMRDTLLDNGYTPPQTVLCYPFITLPPLQEKTGGLGSAAKVLLMGPLTRNIGGDLLVPILKNVSGNYKLTIAGEGPDKSRLEGLIRDAGLSDRVEFTGWVDNLDELYSRHDILIMPSSWHEPFGNVGLEASAHGLPIVAFDLGGCREYIMNNVNGFLIKEQDVKTFAQRLTFLLLNRDDRQEMGARGRAMAEKFFSREEFLKHFEHLVSLTLPKLYPEETK